MPEIVRYVVWHPDEAPAYTAATEQRAWACMMAEEYDGAPTIEGMRAAGWSCSEVRTDEE